MRRASLALLVLLAAFGVLLSIRASRTGDRPRAPAPGAPTAPAAAGKPPPAAAAAGARATVSGVVSGRYGPMAAATVEVRVGGEIVVWTPLDSLGRYRLDVPADVDLDVDAVPLPETELAPARRTVRLAEGEEATLDFELAKGGRASGVVRGGRGWLEVVAIRVEDYPPGPEPVPIGALAAAPKLGASMHGAYGTLEDAPLSFWRDETAFAFLGLDPDATYRLAVLDRGSAIDPPVVFRAGDHAISASLVPALRIYVEATDLETREPLATFRVALVDKSGAVLDSFEPAAGRVSRSLPRSADGLTLVISAEGYREERRPAEGVHRVPLLRTRPPNLVLRLAYEDGTACASEIEARYEAAEDPDGLIETEALGDAPGRFRLTLPAGKWRLHVKRTGAFHDVTRIADIEVPLEGTAEAAIPYRRGGTVTFDSDMTLLRQVEGEWETVFASKGTWQDVPSGTYRVMREGSEHARFEVLPGSVQTVRAEPPSSAIPGAKR